MNLNQYPDMGKIRHYVDMLDITRSIQYEYKTENVQPILDQVENQLREGLERLRNLTPNAELKEKEPDSLEEIRKLRPDGPRQLPYQFDREQYRSKLAGALYARVAGCLLGSIVENWSIEEMKSWAIQTGDAFPPVDYWSTAKSPLETRYLVSKCIEYTKSGMHGAPADDDIIYILASLMILEQYGTEFTTAQVGDFWDQYLPWIYLDMVYPLEKYKKEGLPALQAADDNPYGQLICPYIRIDGYAWICPGEPEKAAELAYRDAIMSHRRNGVYGAMLFAATEAAAFAVDDPVKAIEIGLTEIPADCTLAYFVREALADRDRIQSYEDARNWVDKRFEGMDRVHTINNACLTVFGVLLGKTDITRVISQTVAMGLDNDCNAATAGSISGAVAGIEKVSPHWIIPMQNRIHSYIKGYEYFFIDDVINRYVNITEQRMKQEA